MSFTRQEISLLAHVGHPIACPLSDASVAGLLAELRLSPGARVLDIGCGEGEWLARVARDGIQLCGVDVSAPALAKARERLGTAARLVEALAADFIAGEGAWDAILCNGACHAFGSAEAAIARLAERLAPGGALLFSDGCWQGAPGEAALAALGCGEGDIPHIAQLFAALSAAGLRVEAIHLSGQAEWDEYEAAWCGGLEGYAERIAADAPEDAAQLRAVSAEHRAGYVDGYRGTLGYLAVVARH